MNDVQRDLKLNCIIFSESYLSMIFIVLVIIFIIVFMVILAVTLIPNNSNNLCPSIGVKIKGNGFV